MASLKDILRSVGFSGQALEIAYGIAMAESSGNRYAHNTNAGTGDNSYGLFQINMLGAMGPERLKQYGLSSYDDLFDPYVNARVAFKMSGGGTKWRDWSTYNDGSYRDYMGGDSQVSASGSSTGNGGGGGGGGPAPMTRSETAESYGYVETLFDSVPELKNLFSKATKEGWTTQKFQAALRDTNWWKTTPETERQFLIKQYGDPATAGQMWHEAQIKVQQLGGQTGARFGWDVINTLAYGLMAKGWSEEQLRVEISKYITLGPGSTLGGTAGEAVDKLREYGYQMGVDVYDWWAQQQAQSIVSGKSTIEDGQAYIRNLAKGMFSSWSQQIDAGQTVMDLASPYMKSMVNLLELPAGSVNLKDPTIMQALQYKDPKTGSNAVKPLWQFENDLRGDQRWKSTKNAQDSLMQVAHQVLSDFGVKY